MDNANTSECASIVRTARRAIEVRRLRSESGQTPTEYLMIVGIMAAVILIAFVAYFWPQVKDAANKWSGNAAEAISSSEGLETQPKQ